MVAAGGGRNVTDLLRSWRGGDSRALDELIPIVYDELRRIAAASLRRERPDHTLQPEDLVSEAYMRLSAGNQPDWTNRLHFFAVAARNMRQILVDHSRRRIADKRGGGEPKITFDETLVGGDRPLELVRLDEALNELAKLDERKVRVVELHYFAGLGHNEIAQLLEIHTSTVGRDLRTAEAWIHRFIVDDVTTCEPGSRIQAR